jgi:hypothetical protein
MTKPFWIECCVPSFMVVEQGPLIWIKPGMSAPVRHPARFASDPFREESGRR